MLNKYIISDKKKQDGDYACKSVLLLLLSGKMEQTV